MLIGEPERRVKVSAFAPQYGASYCDIGTVATVWFNPKDLQEYLLIIHQALYFGEAMTHTLLNPNQLRSNGVRVEDCPKQFDPSSTHSLHVTDEDGTTTQIPLDMRESFSGFDSRKPTKKELDTLPYIVLTGTTWDPRSTHLSETEASISATSVRQSDPDEAETRYVSSLLQQPMELSIDDKTHGLYEALIQQVTVTTDEELRQTCAVESSVDPTSVIQFDDEILFQDDPISPPTPSIISGVTIQGEKAKVTPKDLATAWGIGLSTAKRTIRVTTQAGLRNIYAPSERKVRLKAPWLKFPALNTAIYSDQMYSKVPSIGGEVGGTVFTDGKGFDAFYPFRTAKSYPDSMMSFIQEFGVPKTLVTDGASEMQKGRGRATCNEYRIHLKHTVPYSPWQNLAEASVREIKRMTKQRIGRTGAPKRLWSYAAKWSVALRRLTASDIPELQGRTPYEHITGSTPNITPYILFNWYDDVYFHMPTADFPHEKRVLGKLIGVADNCSDELAYVVITSSGIPMTRKSVWAIPPEQLKTDRVQADILELNQALDDRFGDKTLQLSSRGKVNATDLETIPGIDEFLPPPPPDLWVDDEAISFVNPDPHLQDADGTTTEDTDKYLNAELLLPHGESMQRARVVRRKVGDDGTPVGLLNDNPILDSRMYEVQFPDGATQTVTANLIAENLYSQIDKEGRSHQVVKEVTDHRYTEAAIPLDKGYYKTKNGRRLKKHTTKGCELLVSFKDGSANWVPLKYLKVSNPIEIAEYAASKGIDTEPCFNWWVHRVLKKRDIIISKVKSRYWNRTHKYGVRLPHSVKEALAIDAATGTTFWADAISKEMANVGVAFEFQEDGTPPPGYKEIKCHMIFDIKADLTRKARFVAGGHLTDPSTESVFSSVVTRDSVRIAFTYAALNGLDILAADVQNAYLNAPTKEKCWFKAGLEFGADLVGTPVKIVRALYGLRSSGARWRDSMAQTLRDGGFESCLADRDVWMRKNCKPDGTPYWEYVLCYVDDILVFSHKPKEVMDYLAGKYTLKPGSIVSPDIYLGTKIQRYKLDNGTETWSMSSDMYLKRAISDVETELKRINQTLRKGVTTPLSSDYRPELDKSPELGPKQANYYQGLIGVLRWIVEIGRIDIAVSVSMLSRYLANPRQGHLEEALHIFAYLKRYDRSSIVFDPGYPTFEESRFPKCDWSEYYPGAHEPEPPKAPEILGEPMTMTCFVDADHAGCRETRRSHTGVILFIQKTPIIWYSKRQNTVETSTFGSEFCAMRIAVDLVEGLRYKLRMMGIGLDGPTNVFCDNESVFKSSTRPETTIKKRHNAISYHRTREAVAAGIIRIAWEDGRFNLADVLTKLLPGPKLRNLVACILS